MWYVLVGLLCVANYALQIKFAFSGADHALFLVWCAVSGYLAGYFGAHLDRRGAA